MQQPSLFNADTLQNIIERIKLLQPNTAGKWGKMNASQMVKHLHEALCTATGELTVKSPFIFKLLAPFIKKVALSAQPYKPNLPTAKEFIIKSNNLDFDAEKNALIEKLHKFSNINQSLIEGKRHPAFGKLTAAEWDYIQWKHFEHHLTQFGV